jgi:hypothetical protein
VGHATAAQHDAGVRKPSIIGLNLVQNRGRIAFDRAPETVTSQQRLGTLVVGTIWLFSFLPFFAILRFSYPSIGEKKANPWKGSEEIQTEPAPG